MSRVPKRGKWARELQQTADILALLKRLSFDLSAVQGKTPAEQMVAMKGKLHRIKQSMKNKQQASFYDESRLLRLRSEVQKIETLMHHFSVAEKKATKIAKALVKEFSGVIDRPLDFYEEKKNMRHQRQMFFGQSTSYLFSKKEPYSIFESSADPHQRTWALIRSKLEYFSKLAHYEGNEENQLSFLLLPKDEDFVEGLTNGTVNLGDEIGLIAVQRLKEIATTSKDRKLVLDANNLIETFMISAEALYKYDDEALEKEFHKLALHAVLHPHDKTIWLGTGRTIIAQVEQEERDASQSDAHLKGIYLNTHDNKWSWMLNRAYLQAAIKLNYEVRLVEQHFPEVEAAILAGDSVRLVEQLAREIRSPNSRSQYHGGDAPTAASQEILALLDMGCVGHKKKDGSISLHRSKALREEPSPIQEQKGGAKLLRRHSSPNLAEAGPLPPLPNIKDHFEVPGSSSEGRKKASKKGF